MINKYTYFNFQKIDQQDQVMFLYKYCNLFYFILFFYFFQLTKQDTSVIFRGKIEQIMQIDIK